MLFACCCHNALIAEVGFRLESVNRPCTGVCTHWRAIRKRIACHNVPSCSITRRRPAKPCVSLPCPNDQHRCTSRTTPSAIHRPRASLTLPQAMSPVRNTAANHGHRAEPTECSRHRSHVCPVCSPDAADGKSAAPCIPYEFTRSSHEASQTAPRAATSSHSCNRRLAPMTPVLCRALLWHRSRLPAQLSAPIVQLRSYPTRANDPCSCPWLGSFPAGPPHNCQLPLAAAADTQPNSCSAEGFGGAVHELVGSLSELSWNIHYTMFTLSLRSLSDTRHVCGGCVCGCIRCCWSGA